MVVSVEGLSKKQIIENLKEKLKSKNVTKISDIEAERLADEIIHFLLEDNELTAWADYYMKEMPDIFIEASENYAQEWGLIVSLSDYDLRVGELLEQRSQKFAKIINNTTYQKLKENLLEGFKLGEGEKKLAKRVENTMALSKRQRAGTIARTEIFGVVNRSHQMTLQENGIRKKEWLTARDERVRDAHVLADGQIVETNNPFYVGGDYLMYPSDPRGKPENIINCRCVVLPVIE